MPHAVVALDVGGTHVKAALVARDGEAWHAVRRPTGSGRPTAEIAATILDIAQELVEAQERTGAPPARVGVALPGVVDERRGVGVLSANLGWRDVPMADLLRDRLGLPVTVCHDVRAGAVAEVRLGAALGSEHALFVAIGTGVGAALVVHREPYRGAHGRAVELGHVRVAPEGLPCACGAAGCLETIASAAAIATEYQRRTGRATTSEEVARRAALGEPAARGVWAGAVQALGEGLLEAVTLLDPDVVVIGGGLAGAGELLLAPLCEHLTRQATFQAIPPLVLAAVGDRAGCLGAGLLAWDDAS